MGRVVGLVNQKGGVGKTTAAVNPAGAWTPARRAARWMGRRRGACNGDDGGRPDGDDKAWV